MGHVADVTRDTGDTGGDGPTAAKRASRVLAACVVGPLVVFPVAGVLDPGMPSWLAAALDDWTPEAVRELPVELVYFEVLPVALAVAVLVRAVATGDATDVVLAALTVPCLLTVAWAVYNRLVTDPGGYWWYYLFSFGATLVLAGAVLADTAVEWRLTSRALDRDIRP